MNQFGFKVTEIDLPRTFSSLHFSSVTSFDTVVDRAGEPIKLKIRPSILRSSQDQSSKNVKMTYKYIYQLYNFYKQSAN